LGHMSAFFFVPRLWQTEYFTLSYFFLSLKCAIFLLNQFLNFSVLEFSSWGTLTV